MNAYNFPESVHISDAGRDLITKILNNDPSRRPTVDEILAHEWINHEGTIPKLLPASTLACPPSSTYTRQFLPQNSRGNPISGAGDGRGHTAPVRSNGQFEGAN
mmetsp:Transcript_12893/g.17718  ORF Transcript_12893/g.17718 Transcript_12893/m.17718 type:complete len:104 (+) Transcript_12893:351-662(+)